MIIVLLICIRVFSKTVLNKVHECRYSKAEEYNLQLAAWELAQQTAKPILVDVLISKFYFTLINFWVKVWFL